MSGSASTRPVAARTRRATMQWRRYLAAVAAHLVPPGGDQLRRRDPLMTEVAMHVRGEGGSRLPPPRCCPVLRLGVKLLSWSIEARSDPWVG